MNNNGSYYASIPISTDKDAEKNAMERMLNSLREEKIQEVEKALKIILGATSEELISSDSKDELLRLAINKLVMAKIERDSNTIELSKKSDIIEVIKSLFADKSILSQLAEVKGDKENYE